MVPPNSSRTATPTFVLGKPGQFSKLYGTIVLTYIRDLRFEELSVNSAFFRSSGEPVEHQNPPTSENELFGFGSNAIT